VADLAEHTLQLAVGASPTSVRDAVCEFLGQAKQGQAENSFFQRVLRAVQSHAYLLRLDGYEGRARVPDGAIIFLAEGQEMPDTGSEQATLEQVSPALATILALYSSARQLSEFLSDGLGDVFDELSEFVCLHALQVDRRPAVVNASDISAIGQLVDVGALKTRTASASRILDERSSVEPFPCKSSFVVYQQLVHAVATDADVNVKPGGLLSTGEGERTSVSKHELCVVCGLYVKMSTVATLLAYVQTSHLGKVPQVCREHML
jgi:hypothetical protein